MFLLLIEGLLTRWPGLGDLHALDKVTLRASLAAVASFVLALLLGPRLIVWLQARFREPIKSASAEVTQLHQAKRETPTMGGIFIIAGLVASTLAFGDWKNPYLPVMIVVAVALGILGAYDDLVKLTTRARGISARTK